MHAGELQEALSTFDRIVRRKPDFAEGWNKRATIRFLLGEYENSQMDCDEVFSRNPNHFGALAGAGQIHLMLGRPELALDFFRRASVPTFTRMRVEPPVLSSRCRSIHR